MSAGSTPQVPTHLNLLPVQFRERFESYAKRRRWATTLGATLTVCIAVAVWRQGALHRASYELEELRTRVAPIVALQTETRRLSTNNAEVLRRNALVRNLDLPRYPTQLVGAVSLSAAPLAGRLWVGELELLPPTSATSSPESTKPGSPKRGGQVSQPAAREFAVSGRAVDEFTVTLFVEALRTTRVFDRVQLASTAPADFGNRAGESEGQRRYEVICEF